MQKIIIKLSDNVAVEVASEDVKQLVEQASFWNSLPTACPLCQAPLVFFNRTTKDDDSYWGQACTGNPIHEANFGVYKKEGKGFYYKGKWEKAYDAYQNGDTASPNMDPRPTGNAVAQSLGDMITIKQLGMIRALARDIKMDEDYECKRLFNCVPDELSKRAASDFIEHLQGVQKVSIKVATIAPGPPSDSAPRVEDPIPTPAAIAAATPPAPPSAPAPPLHTGGPGCLCPKCDEIPF